MIARVSDLYSGVPLKSPMPRLSTRRCAIIHSPANPPVAPARLSTTTPDDGNYK